MSLFVLLAYLGQYIFGAAVGFYDPAFWQAALLAAGEVILFNLVIWLGLYFNFRGVFRYYVGEVKGDKVVNLSKEDFGRLEPWQRISVLLFLYSFYLVVLVVLYKAHV